MSYNDLHAWLEGPEWAAVLAADRIYSALLAGEFGKRSGGERYMRDDSHHPEYVRNARVRLQQALAAAEAVKPSI